MVIYRKWVDFVIYTFDSERVRTLAQRLDISNAVDVENAKDVGKAVELSKERGAIAPKSFVISGSDEFEAMEINICGDVTIWTKQNVWRLHRLRGYGEHGLEKLLASPRHPPKE